MLAASTLASRISFRSKILRKKLSLFVRHGSLNPSGVHQFEFDGIKLFLDLSAPIHKFIYYQDGFEPELTSVLSKVIGVGETFVDIGANIGWHTISLLKKHPDISVIHAYEPSLQTFTLFNRNIAANNCEDRCQAKRIAISNKKGKATLKTFIGLDPMYSSLFPLADWDYKEEEVELDTLDSQVETFPKPPSVIKCDVEGAERDVMLGATGVLSGKYGEPPVWFLEANYEASGMAGFFPWELIEIAAQCSPYEGFGIRNHEIFKLQSNKALRHGDTLVLAVPEIHRERLLRAGLKG